MRIEHFFLSLSFQRFCCVVSLCSFTTARGNHFFRLINEFSYQFNAVDSPSSAFIIYESHAKPQTLAQSEQWANESLMPPPHTHTHQIWSKRKFRFCSPFAKHVILNHIISFWYLSWKCSEKAQRTYEQPTNTDKYSVRWGDITPFTSCDL